MPEQYKRALDVIGLQERKAIERFFALVRRATPQMRVMAERYGGDVSFNFDSNGRSVWVMALFGKGVPHGFMVADPCPPPTPRRRASQAGPSQPERTMLTISYRPLRGPENLDKCSKTRENRRHRGKGKDQDRLTGILNR
jgi:hypothetical protein